MYTARDPRTGQLSVWRSRHEYIDFRAKSAGFASRHEYNQAIKNPLIRGWYNKAAAEIARAEGLSTKAVYRELRAPDSRFNQDLARLLREGAVNVKYTKGADPIRNRNIDGPVDDFLDDWDLGEMGEWDEGYIEGTLAA